ncbi:MAG: hypothetical protein RL766_1326, partial [Bacteroidota bacterium]
MLQEAENVKKVCLLQYRAMKAVSIRLLQEVFWVKKLKFCPVL